VKFLVDTNIISEIRKRERARAWNEHFDPIRKCKELRQVRSLIAFYDSR
jgi:predicted nucleic acid-binding protein